VLPLSEYSTALAGVPFVDTHERRLGAIDLDIKFGKVRFPRDLDVGQAGNVFHRDGDPVGERGALFDVITHRLDIDGRGRSEVEHVLNDATRIHVDFEIRESAQQRGPQPLDYRFAGLLALVGRHQIDLDEGGVRAAIARINFSFGVDLAGRGEQPDVGKHHAQRAFGHLVRDQVLDLGDLAFGVIDAGADRRANHHLELAFVRGREEFGADARHQGQRDHEDGHHSGHCGPGYRQRAFQGSLIALVQRAD
jgi:hypothetical protein